MESIKQLYKIGHGPSSSHTMGPLKAAQEFGASYPEAASFTVTLFGALAGTGKGHMTDVAILGEMHLEDSSDHNPVGTLGVPSLPPQRHDFRGPRR